MTPDLIIVGVSALVALVVGGAVGALGARLLNRRAPVAALPEAEPERDEFVDAQIDRAAVAYAESHDLPPQAAPLIAARLRTLNDIGKGKGWF